MKDRIVVRGARQHNLKGFDLDIPRGRSPSSPGPRARASRRSPSTRSTPRDSAATSSRSRPTRGSSSSGWRSRRRLHRGALARGRDRAEEPDQDVALHRRHRHRDLRLPAAALGARRPHVSARVRTRAASPTPCSRSPTPCSRCRRAPASSSPSRSSCPTRSRTRSSIENLRAQGFVRVSVDGVVLHLDELLGANVDLAAAQGAARRRRPARRRRRGARPPRRRGATAFSEGDGDARASCSPTRSARRCARRVAVTRLRVHRALRVPERRHARARADAAALLVQQPARRVPAVQRLRRGARVRRGAHRPVPRALAARRRDRSVDEAALREQAARARRVRAREGDPHRRRRGASSAARSAHKLLHASVRGFKGIFPFLRDLEEKRYKQYIRVFLRQYQTAQECPTCGGTKLQPEALQVRSPGAASPR